VKEALELDRFFVLAPPKATRGTGIHNRPT